MQIPSDVAAVERRISEIAGALPKAAVTLPLVATAAPSGNRFESLVKRGAAAWNVDPDLLGAVAAAESGFDPNATSAAGAQGLMQLMPGTAVSLGVTDPYDPAMSIFGGARYIRGLLDRFHNNVRLAVAAYNAGPAAVEKYADVPPYGETQAYVQTVLANYERYRARRAR